MDREEFLKRYNDGERDFSGIEIRDADLSNISLYEAILRGAKLINVDLNRVCFYQADLSEADLSGCNLSNASLTKANLTKADLSDANLTEANLQEANLRNAILTNTDLKFTELIGADLTGTKIQAAINVASHHLLLVDESNNANTELIAEIRELTRGLHNNHNTECSHPYDVFMWDTASRGDFSLEKFLEATGFLVKVDSIDFLENKFPVEEFSFIFQQLKSYITKHTYYYFKACMEWLEYEPLPMLIGNTQTGDWIGICPTVNIERGGREPFGRIEDNASNKPEHAALVSVLKNIDTLAIFSQEKFYYYAELFAWEIAETRDNLLHNLLKSSYMMHFYSDYEDGDFGTEGFFGENDEDDKINYPESYNRNQRLSNIVKNHFKDIKIYWVGDVQVQIYIVGKIETGDWVGIYNKLTHT